MLAWEVHGERRERGSFFSPNCRAQVCFGCAVLASLILLRCHPETHSWHGAGFPRTRGSLRCGPAGTDCVGDHVEPYVHSYWDPMRASERGARTYPRAYEARGLRTKLGLGRGCEELDEVTLLQARPSQGSCCRPRNGGAASIQCT